MSWVGTRSRSCIEILHGKGPETHRGLVKQILKAECALLIHALPFPSHPSTAPLMMSWPSICKRMLSYLVHRKAHNPILCILLRD